VISLFTKPKPEEELEGLVWGKPKEVVTTPLVWYKRPGILAIIVVVFTIAMNLLFW
jgi:SSS family solute:Na+ symporter